MGGATERHRTGDERKSGFRCACRPSLRGRVSGQILAKKVISHFRGAAERAREVKLQIGDDNSHVQAGQLQNIEKSVVK
jgi:hypothetical protein